MSYIDVAGATVGPCNGLVLAERLELAGRCDPVELAGPVGSWDVRGAILATGAGSDGVQHTGEGAAPTGVEVTSEHGRDIVEVPAAP